MLTLHGTIAHARTKVGIVDASGKVIVPCEYAAVKHLGQGLFFLTEADNTFSTPPFYRGHIVDHDGKKLTIEMPPQCKIMEVILPEAFDKRPGFAKSMPQEAIVKIRGSNGFGLYSGTGKSIIEPNYYSIGPSNGGFFPVYTGSEDDPETLAFVLDAVNGNRVAAPEQSLIISACKNELVPFGQRQKSGAKTLFGYMARNGTVVIKPQFTLAHDFAPNGTAIVRTADDKHYAYIDKTGKIISPEYRSAQDFQDGLARVGVGEVLDKRLGLVDRQFKFVLPPKFYDLMALFPGMYSARATADGQIIAIDTTGKLLFTFPPEVVSVSGVLDNRIHTVIHSQDSKKWNSKDFDREGNPLAVQLFIPDVNQVAQQYPGTVDRFLKWETDIRFDSEEFKHPSGRSGGFNRYAQFANFLRSYDVIGMPRKEVVSLLGGDGTMYTIAYPSCAHSVYSVEFEYADGKVNGWRDKHQSGKKVSSGPWVGSNVKIGWPRPQRTAEL